MKCKTIVPIVGSYRDPEEIANLFAYIYKSYILAITMRKIVQLDLEPSQMKIFKMVAKNILACIIINIYQMMTVIKSMKCLQAYKTDAIHITLKSDAFINIR